MLKNVQMLQWYIIFVILIKLVYHVLILITLNVFFKKSGDFSFLIFFADSKNKTMICNYGKIIKQLKDETFSFVDEFEDENFIFDGNFYF